MDITKNDIRDIVKEAVKQCSLRYFTDLGMPDEEMWQEPLIGFAEGDDPYIRQCKKDIGEFFWSPSQAFNLRLPDEHPADEELTILSFILPQTQRTKEDNKKEKEFASKRWYTTRGTWESMIKDINGRIVEMLSERGIKAVAIDDVPGFKRMQSERFGLASKWSHRHAAFAAGLGTFGLSDALITKMGMAVRISTILICGKYEGDRRLYDRYNEYCLFYRDKSCGACIRRCPAGAITEAGHDKEKCNSYINGTVKTKMVAEGLSPDYVAGCGLCQTGVPCQDGVPTSAKIGGGGDLR